MHEPMRPAPEPLDVDAVRVLIGGIVLWFLGFVVLLPFRARLAADGHEIWLWTCLAGVGLGLIGLPLALRQRAAARRARAARTAPARSPVESVLLSDAGPPDPD
jgi:Protein of unknown function (DUF2530)